MGQKTRNARQERLSIYLSGAALAIAIVAVAAAFAIPRPSASSPTTLWANVAADGTLVRGSGVSYVTHSSLGHYFISFDQTITNCSAVATPTGYPPADLLADPNVSGSQSSVNLYIFSATNAAPVNSSFSLTILC